ncbi:MAG: hypothetical protein RR575_02025 [Acinetobacter sp.]
MVFSAFFRGIILLLVLTSLIGCTKNSDINLNGVEKLKNNEEVNAILEFVEDQKAKLPLQVDYYTVWVDINFIDNKLIYIYKISSSAISEQQVGEMKRYYYSNPKKDEICKSIKDLLEMKIVYEYKYINMNGDELVSIPFDEKMCS